MLAGTVPRGLARPRVDHGGGEQRHASGDDLQVEKVLLLCEGNNLFIAAIFVHPGFNEQYVDKISEGISEFECFVPEAYNVCNSASP